MTDSAKKDLVNALAALVKERRLCAQLLSKPYERGTYEATMARFVEFQTAIEAVERALLSELTIPDASATRSAETYRDILNTGTSLERVNDAKFNNWRVNHGLEPS